MGSKVTFKYVPWTEGLLLVPVWEQKCFFLWSVLQPVEQGIEPVVCWSQGEPWGKTEGLSTAKTSVEECTERCVKMSTGE